MAKLAKKKKPDNDWENTDEQKMSGENLSSFAKRVILFARTGAIFVKNLCLVSSCFKFR